MSYYKHKENLFDYKKKSKTEEFTTKTSLICQESESSLIGEDFMVDNNKLSTVDIQQTLSNDGSKPKILGSAANKNDRLRDQFGITLHKFGSALYETQLILHDTFKLTSMESVAPDLFDRLKQFNENLTKNKSNIDKDLAGQRKLNLDLNQLLNFWGLFDKYF